MSREFRRQLESVDLQRDQMHREREFVGIEHAVAVNVGELPDFAENRVGQLRLDELHLGGGARDLAVDGTQSLRRKNTYAYIRIYCARICV